MEKTITSKKLSSPWLNDLNRLRSKQKPQVRAQLERQRNVADNPGPELQLRWFNGMKTVLEEVDSACRFVPTSARLRFLDVGCCPGGFSSYILEKNPNSTGVGISLPAESGGHDFLLEEHLRPRLGLHLADLTLYQLGTVPIEDPRLQPLPFYAHFDLALLDAHPLRTYQDTPRKADLLLVSQLIICLQSISSSGTIVMKLSKPESIVTAQLIYMLDVLSLSLTCWKPVHMHATRPTFYAVAKGVGNGRQGWRLPFLLWELRGVWEDLTYGLGWGQPMANLLDFIVSRAVLERTYMDRLQQLCGHVWLVQTQSLKGWYSMERLT